MMTPKISFQHTMHEIAVNRDDPCELVRELISNAYDANATKVLVFPYQEKRGLVFFDNGIGLSQVAGDSRSVVTPYVAFFSIGLTTKRKGQSIGYKCQGSKLCFASKKVTIITRCASERCWRYITIDSPRDNLHEEFDLTPKETDQPWVNVLGHHTLRNPDIRTEKIINHFTPEWFRQEFSTGTMILIEEFEVADYDRYFAVGSPNDSYLYNYIRFNTAHGDVRRIDFEQSGFAPSEQNALVSHLRTEATELSLMMGLTAPELSLVNVPGHWPYLAEPPEQDRQQIASPSQISRLRDGRFSARFARTFSFNGSTYSVVLAIDGNRRAQSEYQQLGRQGRNNRRCGILLSAQRGAFVCSHGVRIGSLNDLFKESALSDYEVLGDHTEHHVLFIDGPFDVVTNRNALTAEARSVLRDHTFLAHVRTFLDHARSQHSQHVVFKELIDALKRERTQERLDQYHDKMTAVRRDLPGRRQFRLPGCACLERVWLYEPGRSEEAFVGALYTMLAHLVPETSDMRQHWAIPLTFSAQGFDSVSCRDRNHIGTSLIYLEYKRTFSVDMEFNHPFQITNVIVAWDMQEEIQLGRTIADSYDYVAKVASWIEIGGHRIGLTLNDIHNIDGSMPMGHEILVFSLAKLIEVTFGLEWRDGSPQPRSLPPTHGGRRGALPSAPQSDGPVIQIAAEPPRPATVERDETVKETAQVVGPSVDRPEPTDNAPTAGVGLAAAPTVPVASQPLERAGAIVEASPAPDEESDESDDSFAPEHVCSPGNPYKRKNSWYGVIFERLMREPHLTEDQFREWYMKTHGRTEKDADTDVIDVVCSPRRDLASLERCGDIRGHEVAQGHRYYVEFDAEDRMSVHQREAVLPRRKGQSDVEAIASGYARPKENPIQLTADRERELLRRLRQLGGKASSQQLRTKLRWDDSRFVAIRDWLIGEGKVVEMTGKGKWVRLPA